MFAIIAFCLLGVALAVLFLSFNFGFIKKKKKLWRFVFGEIAFAMAVLAPNLAFRHPVLTGEIVLVIIILFSVGAYQSALAVWGPK